MRNKNNAIIKYLKLGSAAAIISLGLSLNGCTVGNSDTEPVVSIDEYQKTSYVTTAAIRGSLTPEVLVFLYAEDEEQVSFYPYQDNVSLDKILVNEGDYFHKGDILATFDSESINDELKAYQKKIDDNKLSIEHLKKLNQISEDAGRTDEIKRLNEEIDIAKLYVKELSAKKNDYNIVAERNGIVEKIPDIADKKNLSIDKPIMVVTYGSGIYSVGVDKYDFKVGEEFKISIGGTEFTVAVTDVNKDEKKAYLKLKEDVVIGQKTISLSITKPEIKDVIYIPASCIFKSEGKNYVYLLDENGYRYAREVEVGETVGAYVTINSGLEENEEVVK